MRTFLLTLMLAATALAQSDGPAQLPQRSLETRASFTPSSNYPKFVGPSDSLAAAMASAVPGDTLVVDPANVTVVNTTLTLASGDCTNNQFVTVRTSSSLIPDEFTRIRPSDAPQLPKIVLNAQNAHLTGGVCFRLIGFELSRKAGGIVYNLVSDLGHDVIFDRVYVHGNATDETVRGLELSNSYNVAVVNSYFSDFHCLSPGNCTDAQAIHGGMSTQADGNYYIHNNYLEAAGENILFGGGGATAPPTDITITNNDLVKPMSWNPGDPSYFGTKFVVKNLFELKNGQRVLFEGNRLSNVWGGFSQVGAMILLTPKNQGSATGNVCPACAVTDVTIRYNFGSYGGQALQLACIPNAAGGWAAACGNWSVHDNVFDHLQYPTCYQCAQFTNEIANGSGGAVLSNVSVAHNTFINDGWLRPAPYATAVVELAAPLTGISGMHFDFNSFDPGNNGIYSTGGGPLNNCFSTSTSIAPLVAKCWPDGSMTGNQFVTTVPINKARLPWPIGNGVPSAGADQAAVDAALAKRH